MPEPPDHTTMSPTTRHRTAATPASPPSTDPAVFWEEFYGSGSPTVEWSAERPAGRRAGRPPPRPGHRAGSGQRLRRRRRLVRGARLDRDRGRHLRSRAGGRGRGGPGGGRRRTGSPGPAAIWRPTSPPAAGTSWWPATCSPPWPSTATACCRRGRRGRRAPAAPSWSSATNASRPRTRAPLTELPTTADVLAALDLTGWTVERAEAGRLHDALDGRRSRGAVRPRDPAPPRQHGASVELR